MQKTDHVLKIHYEKLGTIAIDELKQALWADIEALKDQFGISYVNRVMLIVPATNEYGDPMQIRRLATGAIVQRLDTHHYRPACLDYQL